MRAAAFALLLSLAPVPALAMTAGQMLDRCTGEGGAEAGIESAFCAGFVRGSIDAWGVATELGDGRHFCLPGDGIDMDAAVGAFGTMASADADIAQMPASVVLLVALRRAYPCAE